MTYRRLALAACAAAVMGAPAIAQAQTDQAPQLTAERIMGDPSLSGSTPRGVQFSPDGVLLTYLQGSADNQLILDLWAAPVAGGEPYPLVEARSLSPDEVELSEEEKARRERQRVRAGGIISYSWDTAGEQILVPLDGELYAVRLADNDVRRLTQTEAFETDARISPAGGYVSFIREGALHAVALDDGGEQRLSPPSEGAVTYGMAEFVAQEEMNRYTGYWWSSDDAYVAYTRVDESEVDIFERFDITGEGAVVIQQRYPFTGQTNATVQLFVRNMQTGESVEVDLGEDTDIYLARVNWVNGQLLVQRQNRSQTQLDIMRADPATGATEVLFSETADTWLNLHNDLASVEEGFLWGSERSGFHHLYLYSNDGELIRQVTSGDWVVLQIAAVNSEAGEVYFRGFKDTPLENHLYAVSYRTDDAEVRRITEAGRFWGVSMNADASAFVGTSSSPTQPPQVALYDNTGARLRWIEENALDDDHPYTPYLARHVAPEFGVLEAEDGAAMHYSLLKPEGCSADSPCPAILNVYGGPGVQRVTNSWGAADPFEQLFVQNGYVLLTMDNRGATNRGKAFEDPLHLKMGDVEVRDQLVAAEHLKALDFVDQDRVGVMGWSYGGYMALMLLAKAPDMFKAGISGAPVSDWMLYDTHYTERYLGTPQNNPEGYEASSVFPYLDDLTAPVLIIHGMADDNVLFTNATRVFESLQDRAHRFETMVYPGERHGIYGPRRHMIDAHLDYFLRRL